jgi:hypothetical protein
MWESRRSWRLGIQKKKNGMKEFCERIIKPNMDHVIFRFVKQPKANGSSASAPNFSHGSISMCSLDGAVSMTNALDGGGAMSRRISHDHRSVGNDPDGRYNLTLRQLW